MLILALECSAKCASVAVYQSDNGGSLLGQELRNDGYSHSRTLLDLAQKLLSKLNIKLNEIELIAVAHGPGSFTGIRIGVSAAKGLAFGLDVPVCGVSSLEAMTYQAMISSKNDKPIIINAVIDARRDHVFNAVFKTGGHSLTRLSDDRVISNDDLTAELKTFKEPIICAQQQTAYGVAMAAVYNQSTSANPVYLRPSQAERERLSRKD